MKEIKRIAAFLAAWTMSFAPLAQAKDVEKQNLKQVREMIQTLGYSGPNKAKNMGEVWARAKLNMPPELVEKLDRSVRLFGKDPIPQVKVESIEGSGRTDTVKLVMTSGKETITIELLNGPDHIAKINGLLFSADELIGDVDAHEKILSIPYFRAAILKKKDQLRNGSILPTYEQFKAMNAVDRVHYRRHLAGLLEAVDAVQNAKLSKTASREGTENRYEALVSLLIGEDAEAAPRGGRRGTSAKVAQVGVGTGNGGCVVVGFASVYEYDKSGGKYCSLEKIEENLNSASPAAKELYNKHKDACTAEGKVACNSQIFVTNEGGPVCVKAGRGAKLRDATQSCFETQKNRVETIRGLLIQDGKSADELWTKEGQAKGNEAYKNIMKTLTPIINLIEETSLNCIPENGEPGQKTACAALLERKKQLQANIAILEMPAKLAETPKPAEEKPKVVPPREADEQIKKDCEEKLKVAANPEGVTCDNLGTIRDANGKLWEAPKKEAKGGAGAKGKKSADKDLCDGDTAKSVCTGAKWLAGIAIAGGAIFGGMKLWDRWKKSEKAKEEKHVNAVSPPAPACPAGTNCDGTSTPIVAPVAISPEKVTTPATTTTPATR